MSDLQVQERFLDATLISVLRETNLFFTDLIIDTSRQLAHSGFKTISWVPFNPGCPSNTLLQKYGLNFVVNELLTKLLESEPRSTTKLINIHEVHKTLATTWQPFWHLLSRHSLQALQRACPKHVLQYRD